MLSGVLRLQLLVWKRAQYLATRYPKGDNRNRQGMRRELPDLFPRYRSRLASHRPEMFPQARFSRTLHQRLD